MGLTEAGLTQAEREELDYLRIENRSMSQQLIRERLRHTNEERGMQRALTAWERGFRRDIRVRRMQQRIHDLENRLLELQAGRADKLREKRVLP